MEDYQTKLVSYTADGASVNFGCVSGLLTRMDLDRLAQRSTALVKDALKESIFTHKFDPLYIVVYGLMKDSLQN